MYFKTCSLYPALCAETLGNNFSKIQKHIGYD